MLQEVRRVRQIPGEPFRRWFTQAGLDLIVWFTADRTIHGFQLCYETGGAVKAVTWLPGAGFAHQRLDDGEGRPARHKMTPILVPDGVFEKHRVLSFFEDSGQELDSDIRAFVSKALAAYPDNRNG